MFSSSENIKKLRSLVDNLPIRDAETLEMVGILKLALEHTTDGYWDWDMLTNYVYISPSLKLQLGYKDNEMENSLSSWQESIFEEDLERINLELEKYLKSGGKEQFKAIARYRHKDGYTLNILCKAAVVKWDEAGNPLRMFGTHIDITDL